MRSVCLLTLITATLLSPTTAIADEFGSWWYDGKAELDGYELNISRYGESRTGQAVMIFVTEPFSRTRHVKVNDPSENPDDTIGVLKLNLVRDFQTGIYDYNTMVSVFSRDDSFEPVKVSFSSAEWCGHVYGELVFDGDSVHGPYFSYFEGGSADTDLRLPDDGVTEDNLFILLRGLRGDYLAPGESRTVDYLPGMLYSRLTHRRPEWTRAIISRTRESEHVTVPAGEFETMVYSVAIDSGREGTFHVESAWPHRIIAWTLDPDLRGELKGSMRAPYWQLNGEGNEALLGKIGL